MKYIKRIIIDNFQSHEHSELDFELGLNIIVGQSDKGKSAIIRALKWVLYNEPRGSDFIRFGANECSVTIITGDNYTVTRKRKGNKNIYVVINPDNEKHEFENFGNDVPLEVIQATGINRIKLDTDSDSKLNLNEQLDPPFLLSETGTLRAKTIGRIVNTNIIDAAERDIMKDITNNNALIKSLERQLLDINEELNGYSDIEKQEKNIKKIDILFEKFSLVNSTVEKLKDFQIKINSINQNIDDNNVTLKNLKNTSTLSDKLNELKEKYNYYQTLNNYKNKLKDIISNINNDNYILKRTVNINIIDEKIKTTNEIINVSTKLIQLNEKYKEIQAGIKKGNDYISQVKNDLKNKSIQYSNSLKQLGKCPTCFNLINDSTINQIIKELEGELNVHN